MSFPYNVIDSLPNNPSATVLETRKPAENWSDVIKVAFDGTTYRLGDTVHVKNVGYGNAMGFRPDAIMVSIFQGDGRHCGKETLYLYSLVRFLCRPQSASSQKELNPNKAFKKKKRRF